MVLLQKGGLVKHSGELRLTLADPRVGKHGNWLCAGMTWFWALLHHTAEPSRVLPMELLSGDAHSPPAPACYIGEVLAECRVDGRFGRTLRSWVLDRSLRIAEEKTLSVKSCVWLSYVTQSCTLPRISACFCLSDKTTQGRYIQGQYFVYFES